MPLTTVRYTGAAEPYFETALTGRPQSWRRGQTAEVDSAIATTLIASGLFVRSGDDFDGLIDPSGPKFVGEVEPAVRGAVGVPYLTNASGLRAAVADLMGACAASKIITGVGDSIMQLGGDTANLSSDQLAEQYGFLAALRREMNARLGLSSFDGGQWCPADASPSDTRVANGAGVTLVDNYTPHASYRTSAPAQQMRRAASLTASGHTVTYTVTGRYLDVVVWENVANSYNGTFSYTVDGGGATNVVSTGATDTYRTVTIDMGTQGAHTVVISWVSNKVLVIGAMLRNAAGIATARFGYGGATTYDVANALERVKRTTFQLLQGPLHIIRFSYNDWNKQTTAPWNTTPAAFKGYLQTLIGLSQANTSEKGILLMCDPATSTADNKAALYAEYTAAARELATGTVAFFDIQAAMGAYSVGNGYGYYTDFVHRAAAGFAAEARLVAASLLDPVLVSEA